MTIAAIRNTAPALLTADEERALGLAIQQGNTPDRHEAREILAERNQGLVIKRAVKWQHRGVELDDLIQFGNVGLLTAIDRYDPAHETRFSTYAVPWIEQAIRRGIADTGRLIRVPVHMHERINAVRRAATALRATLPDTPTDADIGAALGLSARDVAAARDASRRTAVASLDKPLAGMDDITLGDAVAVDGSDHAAAVAHRDELSSDLAALRRAVAGLSNRHRLVVTMRYGLDGNEPVPHSEIAAVIGTAKETARQTELDAIAALRRVVVGEYVPETAPAAERMSRIVEALRLTLPPKHQRVAYADTLRRVADDYEVHLKTVRKAVVAMQATGGD
jgi:RNA polymerase sigma factor (sigma-70 family)